MSSRFKAKKLTDSRLFVTTEGSLMVGTSCVYMKPGGGREESWTALLLGAAGSAPWRVLVTLSQPFVLNIDPIHTTSVELLRGRLDTASEEMPSSFL